MSYAGQDFPALNAASGVIFSVITFPGIVANIVAVVLTIKIAKCHAIPPNIFIVTLACTDLFGLIFATIPTTLTYLHGRWVGGDALCQAQGISSIFSSVTAGLVAVLISLDRFFAVFKPFWYHQHRSQYEAKCCVAFAIISSFFFSLLPLINFDEIIIRRYPGTYCTFNNLSSQHVVRGFALAFSALCLVSGATVIMCNLVVCRQMCKQRFGRLSGHHIPNERIFGGRRHKNEMQHARTMAVVSLLYIICWVPFMVRCWISS